MTALSFWDEAYTLIGHKASLRRTQTHCNTPSRANRPSHAFEDYTMPLEF